MILYILISRGGGPGVESNILQFILKASLQQSCPVPLFCRYLDLSTFVYQNFCCDRWGSWLWSWSWLWCMIILCWSFSWWSWHFIAHHHHDCDAWSSFVDHDDYGPSLLIIMHHHFLIFYLNLIWLLIMMFMISSWCIVNLYIMMCHDHASWANWAMIMHIMMRSYWAVICKVDLE